MEKIVVYTDGGARNNPGPAALGVYIETLDKGYGEYLGTKTNNEAEYSAILFALKKIKTLIGKDRSKQAHIDMRMDSELACKQLNHVYKIKKPHIQKFCIEIWNEVLDFERVTFTHVFREQNKKADALVNEALDAREKQGSLM
ncbi:MAG: ribonuclease HI family protein [Candidatus Moraniibacteriota bacterium]